MHVQYWSWLLLWVLSNAESVRRSITCDSVSVGALATPRFTVHCTRASPCHNLDIFCPSAHGTEMLLVDCNGPHACSDVNIYTSVSSTVRCRGRSSACKNINYYCGDMSTVLPLLPDSTNGDNSQSISCKFEHLIAYGTVDSFFGCYGANVEECTSTAITDFANTDNLMYCGTVNTPCVMDCQTSASCLEDILECPAENLNLCQCNNDANCESVLIRGTQSIESTEEPPVASTPLGELPASQTGNVTTTAAAQKTTNKETLPTPTVVTAAGTSTSTSVLTTSISTSTMVDETLTTEKAPMTTVITQTLAGETTEQPSIVTTQTINKETTEQPSIVTTQTIDKETTTKSSVHSTSQSPMTTINMMTTKISSVMNVTGQSADYQAKSTGHVLKAWQLALLIVLPTIAVAISCFVIIYSTQSCKKGGETAHDRLHEEHQKEVYAPLKTIQVGTHTTIETEATDDTMTDDIHHTKCASAQSIDLVVSPETTALNTTTTTTEGDGH